MSEPLSENSFSSPNVTGRQDNNPPSQASSRPVFFDAYADIQRSEHRLPHWQQDNATYFITFHLGDSVPKHLRNRWQEERDAWLKHNPPPHTLEQTLEFHKRFTNAMEHWLDAGHGSCVLRRPQCAVIVADALRFFDGECYKLFSYVVMPNHVHVVLSLTTPWKLEKILHSWKSFTAKGINKVMGGTGSVWQRDYFDRLVRDETHFANCLRYLRENPGKLRLAPGEYLAFESAVHGG